MTDELQNIAFVGDPHGATRDLAVALAELAGRVRAAVFLGDMELREPFAAAVKPAREAGISCYWIPGNHDSDCVSFYDNLVPRHGASSLHGCVRPVCGHSCAGLGGVFRGTIWHVNNPEPVQFATRAEFLASLAPGDRWEMDDGSRDAGIPLRHRTSIFPEDYDVLRKLRADILVTHEAPTTHRFGFYEIDNLAATLGSSLIVHGHHHETYAAEGSFGSHRYRALGVGARTIVDGTGTLLVRDLEVVDGAAA